MTGTSERMWSATEACALAGISYRRLDYWIRSGVLTPAGATGPASCARNTTGPGSGRQRRFTSDQVEMLKACALHAGDRADTRELAHFVAAWRGGTPGGRPPRRRSSEPRPVRATIIECGPGRWRIALRLPNGTITTTTRQGRLVDVDAAVDELLEVIADEWPDVEHLDAPAIEWWINDVLDDMAA